MTRVKLLAHFFAFLALVSLTTAPGATARGFNDAPKDLSAFHSTLRHSIVELSCMGKSQLGVVLESKNNVKSILAAANILLPCQSPVQRNNNQNAQITLADLTNRVGIAAQLLMIGTGISTPFAWLTSKTNLIFSRVAEDRRPPNAGMWIDIAVFNQATREVSWSQSHVTSVDNANLEFTISDQGLSSDLSSGFVFNSHGSFIGLVDAQQGGTTGIVKVLGSPIRCGNAGGATHNGELCTAENGIPYTSTDYWSMLPVSPSSTPSSTPGKGALSSSDFFGAKSKKKFGHPTPTISAKNSITCKQGKSVIIVKGLAPTCPAGYSKI